MEKAMKIYYVVRWATDEKITEVTDLKVAKKHARSMGHTGEITPDGKWYSSVAFVAEKIKVHDREAWGVVYNPRFKAA